MYEAARQIAAQILRGRVTPTWGRTDLASEALARMLGGAWEDRVREHPEEALRAIRTVMRRTLLDYERSRRAGRRLESPKRARVELDEVVTACGSVDLLAQQMWLLDTLTRGAADLRLSRPEAVVEVAELSLVLGLSQREVADHTGIPQTTISHWMRMLRAWLAQHLRDSCRT